MADKKKQLIDDLVKNRRSLDDLLKESTNRKNVDALVDCANAPRPPRVLQRRLYMMLRGEQAGYIEDQAFDNVGDWDYEADAQIDWYTQDIGSR